MPLTDTQLIARMKLHDRDPRRLRIQDFREELVKEPGRPSWGLTCNGYDLRLDRHFKWLDPMRVAQLEGGCISPGDSTPWVEHEADFIVIPPGFFVLAQTLEYVRIPRDCCGTVFGKSTIARVGIDLNTTPLEPEWEGQVTLEISNGLNTPVKLYAGHGICQVVFSLHNGDCGVSYADRKSPTYQGQRGVTTSRI